MVIALAVGFALAAGAFGRTNRHALVFEVHVTLTDKSFAVAPGTLNSQLASSDVALMIVNKGSKAHVLTIKGPGLSGPATKPGVRAERVAPGRSAMLRLKLVTGAYQMSDPALRGTVKWLVIRPATVAGTGGKTKTPTVTNPEYPPGETSTNSWMECAI
jgi:hypothetical protein